MRVLWLCNMYTTAIAQVLGKPEPFFCGWVSGAAELMNKEQNVELAIVFPQDFSKSTIEGEAGGVQFYGFFNKDSTRIKYDICTEQELKRIFEEYNPDLIHIWGTEFVHTLEGAKAARGNYCVVCSTQGLCGPISRHFFSTLDCKIVNNRVFRNIVKHDSLICQQKNFERKGRNEYDALQLIDFVIGRTDWDKACIKQIAPHVQFYECNETLRKSFYEHINSWSVENCERHSFFVSQSYTPYKGIHLAIYALKQLVNNYPDAKLYTTGPDPFLIPWYKIGNYHKYLRNLISGLGLKSKVIFLGSLSENEMRNRFLKSNAFVMCSTIENSPNSLGEAMLLGVPCVSSFVGGSMNMMQDKTEGFFYQTDAPYMMAYYLDKIFSNDDIASNIGEKASIHAQKTHSPIDNHKRLLAIYEEIINSNRKGVN